MTKTGRHSLEIFIGNTGVNMVSQTRPLACDLLAQLCQLTVEPGNAVLVGVKPALPYFAAKSFASVALISSTSRSCKAPVALPAKPA
jgi:hypothetical protein